MSEKILNRFEELSKISRNELIDIQNNIENKLNISFEEAGNQILLEEDKNSWIDILNATKDIEDKNIDILMIQQIIFKEKILKIQLKEANKLN